MCGSFVIYFQVCRKVVGRAPRLPPVITASDALALQFQFSEEIAQGMLWPIQLEDR